MLVLRYRRAIVAAGVILIVCCGILGWGVAGRLSIGGYESSSAESSRAERLLANRFDAGSPQLLLVARASVPITDPVVAAAGRSLSARLNAAPGVIYAQSIWNTSDERLISADGRAALVRVRLAGDERQVTRRHDEVVAHFAGRHGVFTIAATGTVAANRDVAAHVQHDLIRSELLAFPLVAVVLVWVFRSLVAASVPLVVGALTLAATTAVLALLARVAHVTVFALNITTMLGFALAVDYSLIMVSRFREELAAGRQVPAALKTTMATAGRTVAYSAATVALSLGTLQLFPMYFFRSLGWATLAVVAFAAGAALTVVPALLATLGHGIDRGRLRPPRRGAGNHRGAGDHWAMLARWAVDRPARVLPIAVLVLLVLAAPAASVRFGQVDAWWLPPNAPSRVVTEQIGEQFSTAGRSTPMVVLPATSTHRAADYERALSRLPGVFAVGGPGGVYRSGQLLPSYGTVGRADADGTWAAVVTPFAPSSEQAQHLVRQIRAHPAPGPVQVGGETADLIDNKRQIGQTLVLALVLIMLATAVVLFAFTGSLVIPFKALIMNSLSLAAAFGAATWVFQEGHLVGLLGTSAIGYADPILPVLLVSVAFGVGMDYELWLVSRIAEAHHRTGETRTAVICGLRRAGPLVSASATVLVITTGAMVAGQVAGIKLIGFTLAFALIVDLTLMRCLILPAFMAVAGKWNWWAPSPLARLHAWLRGRVSPAPAPEASGRDL
ncbi:MMPL family transporter [Streptomyces sp. NPDC127051]|uniref:MMPL family transporter n=1 Tax=Streptomyces sp. NPDC127051 TaxID=3347119 RepID=UPI00365D67BB